MARAFPDGLFERGGVSALETKLIHNPFVWF
jgi:hypothetical protein